MVITYPTFIDAAASPYAICDSAVCSFVCNCIHSACDTARSCHTHTKGPCVTSSPSLSALQHTAGTAQSRDDLDRGCFVEREDEAPLPISGREHILLAAHLVAHAPALYPSSASNNAQNLANLSSFLPASIAAPRSHATPVHARLLRIQTHPGGTAPPASPRNQMAWSARHESRQPTSCALFSPCDAS